MELDPTNPVIALCAAGMAVAGDPLAAAECFRKAWAARADDCDAAIAAHYVARVQSDATGKLTWDSRAARFAEAALAAGDERVRGLFASLYLNLGDGLLTVGRGAEAAAAAARAEAAVADLPDDGYRDFIAGGIARLRARAETASSDAAS